MPNKYQQLKDTLQFKFFRKVGKLVSIDRFRRILAFFDHYIGGTFRRLEKNHLFLSASGMAYSIILSVIPLVLIIFSVLGNIIDVASIEEQVNTAIDELIPYHASAEYMKRFILSRIPEVVKYRSLTGGIGLVGLFITSTWLFSSMRTVLNKIYKVDITKGAIVGMLRDFGMVLLILVFILLATYILPTINFFVSFTEKFEILEPFALGEAVNFLIPYLSLLLMFLMFYFFYTLIPYDKMGHKVPFASALWATVLWEAASGLFSAAE